MLNLPHDWSVEGDFSKDASAGGNGGYLPTGIGWYRRHFQISRGELNKKVWIEFDGVYMNSDVWINEHHLGHYPNGYNSFYYELTPYLKKGENVIAVKVDNSQQPNSRWYTGSGIYRHVWLVITDPLHISNWGVTVTTPQVSKESAIIEIKTKIENNYDNLRDGVLQTILLNEDGLEIAQTETSFSIESGKDSELIQQLVLKSPELWSIDSPVLYKVHSVVLDGKKKVDDVTTDIGIRKIEFDKDKGFFLNDEHIKMKGVCLHHDGGCVGAAVPERIWERRLQKLKEMGRNAIRTSHNTPAPEFLDLCDRMGFLVMDEAFDEWEIGKREFAYNKYFNEWGEYDLLAMIKRDRNHPSIVIWSVGNEIPEQTKEDGHILLKWLVDICHIRRSITTGYCRMRSYCC